MRFFCKLCDAEKYMTQAWLVYIRQAPDNTFIVFFSPRKADGDVFDGGVSPVIEHEAHSVLKLGPECWHIDDGISLSDVGSWDQAVEAVNALLREGELPFAVGALDSDSESNTRSVYHLRRYLLNSSHS